MRIGCEFADVGPMRAMSKAARSSSSGTSRVSSKAFGVRATRNRRSSPASSSRSMVSRSAANSARAWARAASSVIFDPLKSDSWKRSIAAPGGNPGFSGARVRAAVRRCGPALPETGRRQAPPELPPISLQYSEGAERREGGGGRNAARPAVSPDGRRPSWKTSRRAPGKDEGPEAWPPEVRAMRRLGNLELVRPARRGHG